MSIPSEVPLGFTLQCILRGHTKEITQIAWAPDGETLASASADQTVRVWKGQTGELLQTFSGHTAWVSSVVWSPDGRLLASGSGDQTIRLWDVSTGKMLGVLDGHTKDVHSVTWSPDGQFLASGSEDATVRLWNPYTGQLLHTLIRHFKSVNSLAWSSDDQFLASGSLDQTVGLWNPQTKQFLRMLLGHSQSVLDVQWAPDSGMLASASFDHAILLWEPGTGREVKRLEGHTSFVTSVSFSHDGQFLVSKSYDGTVRVWRVNTGEAISILKEPSSENWILGLAFHPRTSILATLGEKDTTIRIWALDTLMLLKSPRAILATHYTNAKIVLVGDSGVGKSALGLVLSGQEFVATESTHSRRIWTFDSQEVDEYGKEREIHELLLWDLAGQPGYRLVHQLHLNDVAVALIVFDSREIDPFTSVRYWDRALRLAHPSDNPPLKKFLVAARTDRGGSAISRDRINAFMQELGFAGYFVTSAKMGWGIKELSQAVREAIAWEDLPKVRSADFFQKIKTFTLSYKDTGHVLCNADDLYAKFLEGEKAFSPPVDLRSQFETALKLLESRGLIREFSFGKLILLKPELLDAYATALVYAARDDAKGLGSITEKRVLQGDLWLSQDERIEDQEQEKLLWTAIIGEILQRELAIHEQGQLLFPQLAPREYPELANPDGKAVVFTISGSVRDVYIRLVVRLAYSGIFEEKEIWNNVATYTTKTGGTYGILLHRDTDEHGELTLFFDSFTSQEMRFFFEEFVQAHLQRYLLPGHVIQCQRIQPRIPLFVIQEKAAQGKFDVFLCHNQEDKAAVKEIGNELKKRGILPWLDEWELPPGVPWQRLLEQQINQIKSAIVFVGKNGFGPWQQQELEALLREFVSRGCPVIPVLLPDTLQEPILPLFLKGMTWVDFRRKDPDPLIQLIWGITGNKGLLPSSNN